MPFVSAIALFPILVAVADWTPQRLLDKQRDIVTLNADEKALTQWFGGDKELGQGANSRQEGLVVAFALKAKGAKSVTVESDWPIEKTMTQFQIGLGNVTVGGKAFSLRLRQVGHDGLFVGAAKLPEGTAFSWHYSLDGSIFGGGHNLEAYTMPPESRLMPGVTAGQLRERPKLVSKVFGGTSHEVWVWTPPRFDPDKESNLVVFQDGQWSHNYAPVYFDNMVANGDLPQTVVVFVTPGVFPDGKSDRSREYDTLSDAYSRFLLEELLPPIESQYRVTQDPMRRCVAGLSSGGICAFTAAWSRPDKFGLVLSWIGSFANIASGDSKREGGHNYPALIRKTEKKPIRVFLQDGANDLDNVHGNWPLGNREMAKALEFQKYDVMTVWGNGFHSDAHGRACMANALRWLFKTSSKVDHRA